jgi:serine phosphatase RsbU (regulator of sigma subunit)
MILSSDIKNNFFKANQQLSVWRSNLFPKKQIVRGQRISKENDPGYERNKKDIELNESIIYAKRIQEGMMLKEKHLFRLFPESFLLFRPKDIVSGDFYWFTKIENKTIIAVADCTGHGIPGAFMSVLGISLLNQIVIEEKNTNVSFILQRLNHKIKKAFSYSSEYHEDEKQLYDGMDIAMCCIDSDLQQLTYSGAFRPLFHITENNLIAVSGSRYPIGGLYLENERKYESKTMSYRKGDKLYLFTDGFADQFGGDQNKKLMIRNFKNILLQTANLPMDKQKTELEKIFHHWKKEEEQTDDILIIGLEP